MQRRVLTLLDFANVEGFTPLPEALMRRIEPRLTTLRLEPGEVLFRQGRPTDGIYAVVTGRLCVLATGGTEGEPRLLGRVEAGEIVGELQALTNGLHTATVQADSAAEVVRLPTDIVRELVREVPELAESLAALSRRRLLRNQLALLLPRLFGALTDARVDHIGAQGRWVRLQPGATLLRQGAPCDAMYLVVSGRLQAVVEADGTQRVVAEMPRGQSVGEGELLTGASHPASVRALRESDVFAIPKAVFDEILSWDPGVLRALTRTAIARAHAATRPAGLQRRVRCVALLPIQADVPADELAERLGRTLGPRTLVLTPSRLEDRYGTPGAAEFGPDDPGYVRLTAWLDEQEDRYDHLLYVAHPELTPWTRQVLQRADHIYLCAWADAAVPRGSEALWAQDLIGAELSKSLVLLHPPERDRPSGTAAWLAATGVQRHFHVRWPRRDDIARVGRFLSDRAVGLALSGGGARGLAHIGIIQAFKELDIPIDAVGGTSMGACIAALAGLEYDIETMKRHTWETFVTPKPFKRYTLPVFSLLRDRLFDASARRAYGSAQIEDCWIPTFAVSSNLTTAELVVAERGDLAEAVLASMALPGMVTPRIQNGQLLADGGLLNNLPVDVMRARAHRVVAVDVGSGGEGPRVDLERFPSPGEAVLKRLSPVHRAVEAPSLLEVILRTTLLASAERTRAVKAESDLYLQPPLEGFGFMDMARQEEIIRQARRYGLEALATARAQLVDFEGEL